MNSLSIASQADVNGRGRAKLLIEEEYFNTFPLNCGTQYFTVQCETIKNKISAVVTPR